MTNYHVVKKLIGPITPIGETTEDNRRFDNLEQMCKLMWEIHTAIKEVSLYKDEPEYSLKRTGKYAQVFLASLV